MNHKRKNRFFELYISKLLKNISSKEITNNAKKQLNSVICTIIKIICDTSFQLTIFAKKRTISEKELCNSIFILFPKNMAEVACQQGEIAIQEYLKNNDACNLSKQSKANIIFPPSICEKFLRNFGYNKVMITHNTSIYLASIIQYLTHEILLETVKMIDHIRITVADLEIAFRDAKFNSFIQKHKIIFLGGKPLSNIHSLSLADNNRKICEIKKMQTDNSLVIAKTSFERIIRILVEKLISNNIKISKEVFTVLQYYIEQYIVNILHQSNLIAIHSGRMKVLPADIYFIKNDLRK